MLHSLFSFSFFFFNETATTEIYTLSLHDALPIYKNIKSFSRIYDPTPMRAYAQHDKLSVMPFGEYGEIGRAHV